MKWDQIDGTVDQIKIYVIISSRVSGLGPTAT